MQLKFLFCWWWQQLLCCEWEQIPSHPIEQSYQDMVRLNKRRIFITVYVQLFYAFFKMCIHVLFNVVRIP
jgi:hypothetical protein